MSPHTSGGERPANRLIHETSPYLLQHAYNPVDWYPWGPEALETARRLDRPILLSVGYSACHWCHVMERESFENPEIAALMNAEFVCVKVDREERPDVDQIYMNAVQALTGQGGWPMTVFLTPEGKPFYGGTYYPPDDRWGRPGFPRILRAVAEAWREKRAEIEEQGAELVDHLRRSALADLAPAPLTADLLGQAVAALARQFDERHGGFGGAPKFPQPMVLEFLLRQWARRGDAQALHMTEVTLRRMAQGGLRDHLAGGFHRYSTDAYWLVPHFEKMLYDNAQLARAYLQAYQATGNAFYREVCEQTLDYVRREMTDPAGGFYSSQDADSEGEEGKHFVWTPEEVEEILGQEDAALFMRVYDVTPRGNFEGKNVLNMGADLENLARALSADVGELRRRMEAMRARLLERRERRVKPPRDEKVIAAWNGLMLAAFAEAGAVLGRADYLQTAVNNAEFVLCELADPALDLASSRQPIRLLRTGKHVIEADDLHPGQQGLRFKAQPIPGFLEDYALYALGLIHLYEAVFDARWLNAAVGLVETILQEFDSESGPFFDAAASAEPLVDRPRDATDNAVPSGNSAALEALARLAAHTGDDRFRARAERGASQLAEAAARHPLAFGRLLCVMDRLVGPRVEVAIVGDPEDPTTERLLAAARGAYRPNLTLALARPGETGASAILEGRPMANGVPTAYVCRDSVCSPPVNTAEALTALLDG
jgi:uncharacterized protein YyaL (SSP411 family)